MANRRANPASAPRRTSPARAGRAGFPEPSARRRSARIVLRRIASIRRCKRAGLVRRVLRWKCGESVLSSPSRLGQALDKAFRTGRRRACAGGRKPCVFGHLGSSRRVRAVCWHDRARRGIAALRSRRLLAHQAPIEARFWPMRRHQAQGASPPAIGRPCGCARRTPRLRRSHGAFPRRRQTDDHELRYSRRNHQPHRRRD
jgi:hypothetical protein